MSKKRSPEQPRPKRKTPPPKQRASIVELLVANGEIITLILLLVVGFLLMDTLRRGDASPGAMRQLFGWAGAPILAAVLLVTLAVLVRQASGRLGLGLSIPWREMAESSIGLALALMAVLGLSHLWGKSEDPLALALAGQGGGLAGWLFGSLPAALLGDLITSLLLLALVGLGILLALRPFGVRAADWSRLGGRLGQSLRLLLPDEDQDTPDPPPGKTRSKSIQQPKPDQKPKPAAADAELPSIAATAPPQPRRQRAERTRPQARPIKPQPRPDHLPPLDLLAVGAGGPSHTLDIEHKSRIIEQTLASFNVPAKVVDVNVGPTVTQFGVQPSTITVRGPDGAPVPRRVRVSRIRSLSNDLALALEAPAIRIEAPVPGKGYVGIEVPNASSDLVTLRAVLESQAFMQLKASLALALGRDVSGHPVAADLAAMPHLLIAGATGSGKSVCINAIIASLLFSNGPDQLRLLLVDPKRVELPAYNGVPHLVSPVVTDVDQVVGALTWLTLQMDERYRSFARVGARHVKDYNRKVDRKNKPAEWRDLEPYPYLVVVIDELADLMLSEPEKVEYYVCRLAQMARATGIHLVISTQRPSVDVVTGLIKANFPARIAFGVTTQMDSRVILDTPGAEKLLGRGDMLFMRPDSSKLDRIQGCLVSDKEVAGLVRFWKEAAPAEELPPNAPRFPWTGLMAQLEDQDELYDRALDLLQRQKRVSTSWLQRRLRVSYNKASELMARMEADGYVGPDEGAGRGREVYLASNDDEPEMVG